MTMLELDGSHGGGQLLRSALSLSLCTGTPFLMRGIRAGRSRPGLMRQHLTAVDAATRIGNARVEGATAGSTQLRFHPGAISAGDYAFSIGTAGSTTLVLQTLLPALAQATMPSTLRLEGGTHNPLAPPAEFLQHAFAPLLARSGINTHIELQRHGFAPAGGGAVTAQVSPRAQQPPLQLHQRGALRRITATALLSGLDVGIGERELRTVARRLQLNSEQLQLRQITPPIGPGNVVLIRVECEHVTEVFSAFGERGFSAERVAEGVARDTQQFLASDAAVGTYLADQLLLPLALAGGGSFTTTSVSDHATSNAALIEKFLPVEITFQPQGKSVRVEVTP